VLLIDDDPKKLLLREDPAFHPDEEALKRRGKF
jgi:hypothetical protein